MWPRVMEMLVAIWLLLAPFIFGHYRTDPALTANDWICATVLFTLAATALHPRLLRIHFFSLLVLAWLAGYGYVDGGYPASPGHQNEILVALILLLTVILPTDIDRIPAGWRSWYQERDDSEGDTA